MSNTEWDGMPMPGRVLAIISLMSAIGLAVLDGVIVNIALPTICEMLSISASSSIWIVNAYQIAIIVSLLPLSAMGDWIGYRKILLSGLMIFTLMSIGCALSWNFSSLVAFRVLQGVGASAIMSVNTSIVRLIFPRRMLGRGLGINSTIVSVASVAGPTIAAAILATASWPWLFAVNVPIGICALLLGFRHLPENPVLQSQRGFRWRDAALNALTFGLLFSLVTGFTHGVEWWILLLEAVALICVGYIYVNGQLGRKTPILPFDLLRIPIFSLSVLTSILTFVAQMSIMVAMPFILQRQFGYTPLQVGAVITAWPIVNFFATPIAGVLVDRYNPGVLGFIGLLVLTLATTLLALTPPDATSWQITLRLALCGFGFGFFQAPNNNIIITSAPLERSGSASGMMATARLTGQILGAASVAMLFYITADEQLTRILLVGAIFSGAAMVISLLRLRA